MSQFDWLVAAFPWTTFAAFDTETTGLEPKLNRVVEAGAIRFDALGVSARFNSLINPKIPMPPEVTKVNGITDAMLAKEPDAAKVLPDFIDFLADSVLIAHNAPFDVAFINEELARLGMQPLRNRVIDTRIFAKEIYPGLPNYRLQDLARNFGIEAIDAHRAEDDARVCMELFLVCLKRLKETRPDLVQAAATAETVESAGAVNAQSAQQAPKDPFSAGSAGTGAAGSLSASRTTDIEPALDDEAMQEDLFGDDDSNEFSEEEI
jgi:DNA polymerase-3 subunit epsilon